MAKHLIDLTTRVVTAHLSTTALETSDVIKFIEDVHKALQRLDLETVERTVNMLERDPDGVNPIGKVLKSGASSSTTLPVVDFRNRPRVIGESHEFPGVFGDYIVCFEDGKHVKLLRAYIRNHYGLSPEQYRQKWELAEDYPMVPPEYRARKSSLAKEVGLGITRRGGRGSARSQSAPQN